MDVETFVAVLAVAVLIEELTLAHLAQVVLVEIITGVPLFAETLEPMLAYVVVILVVTAEVVVLVGLLGWCRVSIGTSAAARTVPRRGEIGADRDSRGNGGEVIGAQEGCETECVGLGLWVRGGRGSGGGGDGGHFLSAAGRARRPSLVRRESI